MLNKLMGLATVGGAWANIAVLNRFLSNAALVILLTVASALFCSFLILGIFFAMYLAMVHYGVEPFAASMTVFAIIIALTAALISITVVKLRGLREVSWQNNARETLGLAHIANIAEAFLEGLNRRGSAKN